MLAFVGEGCQVGGEWWWEVVVGSGDVVGKADNENENETENKKRKRKTGKRTNGRGRISKESKASIPNPVNAPMPESVDALVVHRLRVWVSIECRGSDLHEEGKVRSFEELRIAGLRS